jgi:small subunit ribosomal protein S11
MKSTVPSKTLRRGRYKQFVLLVLRCTLNNFFFTVRSRKGKVIFWGSCGTFGYRGPRRATPLATEQSARRLAEILTKSNFRWVEVHIQSLHNRRTKAALKGLGHNGQLKMSSLSLATPIAHNGIRPAKARRV